MSEWVIAERFEVRNTLGSGAHSTVLEVFDRFNENPRALKLSNGTTQRRRFREEFERLSRLRHPNVIRAYDLGLYENRPFYTTELVDGVHLREFLAGAGP
ncbi:MAG: protein kinase, partial [Myxococcota bacterium]